MNLDVTMEEVLALKEDVEMLKRHIETLQQIVVKLLEEGI